MADPQFSLPHSIPSALRRTAALHGSIDAVVDRDVRLSYQQLERSAIEVARALVVLGVSPGDRVAIWAQNSWQWCVAAMGIASAGAVIVPINTRFRGKEAAQIVDDSGPVAMFTTTGFLNADYPSMLRTVGAQYATLPVIVMEGDVAPCDISWSDFLARGAQVPERLVLDRIEAVTADDLLDIMYTSGSTGLPKGVMQTHGKNVQAVTALGKALTLGPGDRTLTIAPMFAQFGLRAGLFMDVLFGATTIIDAVFDVDRAVDLIESEQVTIMPGPPTILSALVSPAAANRDLSSLRVALMGSTVIPEELVIELLQRKVFDYVMTAWGLTEACGIVSISPLNDPPHRVVTCVGKVVDHLEVKVVDAEGNSLPAGEPGRLLVRGPTVMDGYLGDPALTAAAINSEGWLDTGDVGSVDSEGYVKITGRTKDIVIVGGFNVYPPEVESAMRGYPDVRDVALVGIPDERLGEVIAAFVVAEPTFNADEFTAWCRIQMANHKVPRVVVVVEALPLNSSLKVDKEALRRHAAQLTPPHVKATTDAHSVRPKSEQPARSKP